MTTRTTPRIALLGIALCMIFIPMLSGKSQAQQVDLNVAAAAKAEAAQAVRARTTPDAPSSVGTFISFDVSGAVNGTYPSGVNPAGAITGIYNDANFIGHGFLRGGNGAMTTFDVPAGISGLITPLKINPAGDVVGTYADANFALHGFVRDHNGRIITFDAPGGGTGGFQGTEPFAINPAGMITGVLDDANNGSHGFLRDRSGRISIFDAPGACPSCPPVGFYAGTVAVDIGPDGTVVGTFNDANNNNHGFLRARDGAFTLFDPPGQINAFVSINFITFAANLYINPEGVVTGAYFESISGNPLGGNYRVFVRTPDGNLSTFDAANYPPCCIWSVPFGINPAGEITGEFNDAGDRNHGFLRATDSTVTTFDVPAAGTGFSQGTVPLGITPAGVIMGLYRDPSSGVHGFVLLPQSFETD